MNNVNVTDIKSPKDSLTELLRSGARQLITGAVAAELEELLETYSDDLLPDGKSRVVRNGYLPERQVMTGIGSVDVCLPRVRDRGDSKEKVKFRSSIIPPYMRRSATINEVLPILYLKGISEGDFVDALKPLFGAQTKNLSPGVISRLKRSWEKDFADWKKQRLDKKHYVYWWVDGIHFPSRGGNNQCMLVVIGVDENGFKEQIALEAGYRESTESWLNVLRDLKARGANIPALAIGDGALGFWNAVTQVFPETKHQRCWFHKMGNVLDKLPKSQQAKAKKMLQEIWMAATRKEAYKAFDGFLSRFGAKYPKATDCLLKDKDELLAFYDFPAEHWIHIRTTNPIESTFATVRHRTYKAKGAFSEKTIVLMTFKLMESAQKRWRRLRGFKELNNVIRGVKFIDGVAENKDEENKINDTKQVQQGVAA